MSDIAFRVLHELIDVIEIFSQGINKRYVFKYVNPLSILFIFIALTVIAAYSHSDIARAVILAICILQILVNSSRKILLNILKVYIFIIILAIFLGLPSIFLYTDRYNIALSIIKTVFVSISASTPIIVFTILVGLKEIGRLVTIFSKTIGRAIAMFSIALFRISQIQIEIMLMRFSRNLSSKRSYIWKAISSAIGDTLIHTNYISQMMALAIKSRTVSLNSFEKSILKPLDYLIIATSIASAIAVLVVT